MKRTSYKDIVTQIVKGWAALSDNCFRNCLIKAWKNSVVSSDNDYTHDDIYSEMETKDKKY